MTTTDFQAPTAFERFFNNVIGSLVRLGASPGYARSLEVRGRKSGKLYTTPVNLLDFQGKRCLVAARGHAQWSRNTEAVGEITLTRGRSREVYRARLMPVAERAPFLREYLERYHNQVQRFFSVQRGAPLEAFAAIAERHPVFELSAS